MSIRPYLITALALITLAACKEREDLAFFSQSEEAQRQQMSEMDTTQVYHLYKLSFELPPPPTYELLPVIGGRGEQAILAWIEDLKASETPLNEVWEYGPLLREVSNRTSVTICHDQAKVKEASALLAWKASISQKDAELSLRTYC